MRRIGLGLLVALLVSAVPAPALGTEPAVVFRNPAPGPLRYRDHGTITIDWVEPASLPITHRVLVRQRGGLDVNGGCAGSSFPILTSQNVPAGAVGDPNASGHRKVAVAVTGHEANHCYRYRVQLTFSNGNHQKSGYSGNVRTVGAWTGGVNIYRSSAFSTQHTYVWCVAASVQMARNYVKHESDHSYSDQQRYYDYARAHDRFEDWRFPGTDAQGWGAALRYFTGVSHYAWRAHDTYRDSIRFAALSIRRTGQPVGLGVARGGHAWVMTGFRATADPISSASFEVTDIYISGPLYPMQQSNGYDRPPNTRFNYGYMQQFFLPFRSLPHENSELWDGKFVSLTGWSN